MISRATISELALWETIALRHRADLKVNRDSDRERAHRVRETRHNLVDAFCSRNIGREFFKPLRDFLINFAEPALICVKGKARWSYVWKSSGPVEPANILFEDLGECLIEYAALGLAHAIISAKMFFDQKPPLLGTLELLRDHYEKPFPRRDAFPSADPTALCLVSGSRNTLALE
jgi:hypothetical protein